MTMFVSNIRAIFLKKFSVLFSCYDTNEYCETGIVLAIAKTQTV